MAGRKFPHRHINRRALPLQGRNVDEVALYFKELRQFAALQPSLIPNISIKALPDGAVASGAGKDKRTIGSNATDDAPIFKFNYDPKAKRKPGQILKLHVTKNELLSKEGAQFGWVDKPGPKTREDLDSLIEQTRQTSPMNSPVYLRRYKRDLDGQLTAEIDTEVRVKALGRTIGSTMGRVSTQAFQAAGGIIDANGKLRCPPGTPNANQFTDLDMSNCMAVGIGTLTRGLRSIREKFSRIVGSIDERQITRPLTEMEQEQQDTFTKTRTAITSAERVAEVARQHGDILAQAIKAAGTEFDDSVGGGNFDLIMAWRSKFPSGPDGDKQFAALLFGDHFDDSDRNALGKVVVRGGILGDILGEGNSGFEWQGDYSPESIKANLARYDQQIREKLTTFLPEPAQQALRDPDAPKELKDAAQQLLDQVRLRHHLAQREAVGTTLVFREKYPEAFQRMGGLRAFTEADLASDESMWGIEGSCRPDLSDSGDLSATVSFNAVNIAISSMYGSASTLQGLDDGSWFIDVGNTTSETEKIAKTVEALQQITDALQFAESVSGTTFANESSSARLASAFGTDAVVGRARHVMWHELGHVFQYHAFQQKIIDVHSRTGQFPMVIDGRIVAVSDPPSLWTNEMWSNAIATVHMDTFNGGIDFPPGGLKTFEKDLVHLFAGKYYQDELDKAQRSGEYGKLRIALTEGSTEIFAQREMGIIEGPAVDASIKWMLPEQQTYKTVASIPYEVPPRRNIEDIPAPNSPDLPTSSGLPRDGAGSTTIYNGPVVNGPVNITIINGSGVQSEMDTPSSDIDKPRVDASGKPQPIDIAWTDISGHIFMDEDTQWSPTSSHNIELEQNPDEIRRIVDAAFGFGPELGGPDPTDKLGTIRQKKDAYWKMDPATLDARYEALNSEFVRLRDKSMTEPLSPDEQARMWLAAKGMRQILDVNTRKSKMSDEEIARYQARGFDPQPGKYMRKIDSKSKPQQKRFRQYAIDKRKARGFDTIEEVDDDELTHWSREIGHHVGDSADGRPDFDGSSRPYDPDNIRNSRGMSIKEKRKRNPEYEPTDEEVKSATLATDPEVVGQRKIDQIAQRSTPQEKAVLEKSDTAETTPIVSSLADHASTGDTDGISRIIDQSAKSRRDRRAGLTPDPTQDRGEQVLEEQIARDLLPLLDLLDKSTVDEDMSMIVSFEIPDDLAPGQLIDHGGPVRGLLVPEQASENFPFASPSSSKRAIVILPKGSHAMHAKNAHNGDTDGVIIPPGSLEVVRVDPDGTVLLMPSSQKTAPDVIDDAIKAFEAIDAPDGSPASEELSRVRSLLLDERNKRSVASRSVRGTSGDSAVAAKADIRSTSVHTGFAKTGSDYFGTSSTAASFLYPDGRPNYGGNGSTTFAFINKERQRLADLLDPITASWFSSMGDDEVSEVVDNALFRFHEAFDDRPRMLVNSDRFGELIESGKLSNPVESKPQSITSKIQKDFEANNGLSDAVPDSARSHFGFMSHASSEKEIQDYLDEMPHDGMIREARYFSSNTGINQYGDMRSGGNNIELVMKPELAKRTAYAKGNVMSGDIKPTPVLSTDRNRVRDALLANLGNSKNNEEFAEEVADVLLMAQSGNMASFGSGFPPSSRSSRSRSAGPTYEAVIGGGVNINDIEQIKIDVQNLESVPVSADDLGGRDELIRLLSDAGVKGDVGSVLDSLLRGDSFESLPADAKFLHTTFERMRAHKAATSYVAKMKQHYGESIDVVITNPDGIDLTSIDAFTDIPSIDKAADEVTKLRERLRYDIYGAKMRTLDIGTAEREYYKVNGRLPVAEPDIVYVKPGAITPDSSVHVGGPIGVQKPPRNRLDPWLGKPKQTGRYSVIDDKSPGWRDSDVAFIEYDPNNGDLHVISKSTGEIRTIHNVDPLEVIQLSQGVDDSGGFESIDGGVKRILDRMPEREMTDAIGKRQQVAERSRRQRIDDSANSAARLMDEASFPEGFGPPARRIAPRGQRGPVAKLRNWSDEELLEELNKHSKYAWRPFGPDRNRPELSIFTGDADSSPSLNDLARELDSRGYDVFQSQGTKPQFIGDYASGDKIVFARKRPGETPLGGAEDRGTTISSRSSRGTPRSGAQRTFEDAVSLGVADDPSAGLHVLSDDELSLRFNAERTGRVSVADGTEVFRVNDVETAAGLIAAGYHVELGDGAKPAELVGASAKLQKEIDAIIPELRKRLGRDDAGFGTIDTCRLYKAGSNIFCEGGLGTFREDMPQLSGRARGDDALIVGAMKGGVVKTKWAGGKRKPDGTVEKLTPEEALRFDELKARHASPKGPGDLSPEELQEFYSLVDWNDTEADLTPAFREFVRQITGREDAIQTVDGILPSTLSASQGQIQMGKTGGMVISMRNHDYSFNKYMSEAFPDIQRGSDEYFAHRDAWLYKGTTPDGKELRITMYDVDGNLIDKDGNRLPEGAEPFILSSKPWYTDGSIISTSDGFVVDGHHRWASFMAYNEGKPEREQLRITSEVMDMPIDDALSVGKVVQDHWGIKPAVLGQETFFKGDAANASAIDADRFTREMADIRATSQDRIKDARNLYFKKEGFGFTESRADRVRGGGVRVQREGPISSRSAREQVGSRGRSGDTTPGSKRSARDKFEDIISLGAHDDENSGLHTLSDEELDSRFSATRTDLLAASDGMPVYRVDDVESAAALLAAGYHVELGDNAKPKKLVRASNKLQKEIDKVIPELRKKYGRDDAGFGTIDTCRLYKAGTNIFCSGGLGTFREDMPQLSGRAKGDDAVVVGAMKAGRVATDWKPGRRKPDGSIEQLTPEEQKRFDELSARHAKTKNGTFSPGDLTDEEKAEFYSLVDWNDTEADLLPEFRNYVASVTGRSDAIKRRDGLDPNEYNASQGQIQMGKTAGMVISMENHDYSFSKWMQENHPDIDQNSDEFFEWRSAWLYGREAPDGSRLQIPLYDTDGTPLDKKGNPFRDADGNIIKDAEPGLIGQPWFTNGSIIVTKDGFVVDGHHRWASFVAYNEDLDPRARLKINAEEMDMPIDEALSIGKVMQDHWGIKPAVLGKETFFRGDGVSAPELSADELDASQATLIDEAPSRMPAARDLYVQKEGFGFTESRTGRTRGGGVRVQREAVGQNVSSRSSRSRTEVRTDRITPKSINSQTDAEDLISTRLGRDLSRSERTSMRSMRSSITQSIDANVNPQVDKALAATVAVQAAYWATFFVDRGALASGFNDIFTGLADADVADDIAIAASIFSAGGQAALVQAIDSAGRRLNVGKQKLEQAKARLVDLFDGDGIKAGSVNKETEQAIVDAIKKSEDIAKEMPRALSSRSSANAFAAGARLTPRTDAGGQVGAKRPKKPGKMATELGKRDYMTEMAAHIIRARQTNEAIRREFSSVPEALEKVKSNDMAIDKMVSEFNEVANSLSPESRRRAQSIIDSLEQSDYGRNWLAGSGAIMDLDQRNRLPRSSRSSRSDSNQSRNFSDNYPMISRIGINPRPPDADDEGSYLRSEAEALIGGASVPEMRRAEQIAKEAVDDVEARRESVIASIVEELGSQQAFDDLLVFDKPTPKEWTDLSPERRQAISDMLSDIQRYETERFMAAKEKIADQREAARAVRAGKINQAKARSAAASRSTRADAIRNSVPLERVGGDLADAFERRGASGVMSKLRSMLRNDSSDWAVDYAIERGYISKSQGKMLKSLARGLLKRVILPGLDARRKKARRSTSNSRGRRKK